MRHHETNRLVYGYVCRESPYDEIFTKNVLQNDVKNDRFFWFSRRGYNIFFRSFLQKMRLMSTRRTMCSMRGRPYPEGPKIEFEKFVKKSVFWKVYKIARFSIVTRERLVEIGRFFFLKTRLNAAHPMVWPTVALWCSPSELQAENWPKSDKLANRKHTMWKCNSDWCL